MKLDNNEEKDVNENEFQKRVLDKLDTIDVQFNGVKNKFKVTDDKLHELERIIQETLKLIFRSEKFK